MTLDILIQYLPCGSVERVIIVSDTSGILESSLCKLKADVASVPSKLFIDGLAASYSLTNSVDTTKVQFVKNPIYKWDSDV